MKYKKILIILSSLIFIFAVFGMAITDFITNGIIEEAAQKQLEKSPAVPRSASEVSRSGIRTLPAADSAKANDLKIEDITVAETDEPDDKLLDTEEGIPKEEKVKPQADKKLAEAAAPANKLEKVSQQVLAQEKLEVLKIVISKLSAEEIAELGAMAADGIDAEEQKKMQVYYSRLSQEELEYLNMLFYKYLK